MGGGDLDVFVDAEGGAGSKPSIGAGGDGGEATLGSVVGRSSTGANVKIAVQALGGSAGNASTQGRGGDGASVILLDRVEGQTAGELALSQRAVGGRGGDSISAAASLAGAARSEIEKTTSSAALSVETSATGGDAGRLTAPTGAAAQGADAAVRAIAINDAGSAAAKGMARGGIGGNGAGGAAHGAGANASLFASAQSAGEGHDVLVGDPSEFSTEAGAIGGRAGQTGGTGAAGGDANSESHGEALGEGAVRVFDRASGGNGADDGDGGAATSSATGRNAGSRSVEVSARAVGGRGGTVASIGGTERGGNGGAAQLGLVYGASTGGGDVTVLGEAYGGDGGGGDLQTDRPPGDGASVQLHNAVDGDTSGRLFLKQYAGGGRVGYPGLGQYGATSSVLEVTKSAALLDITARAFGSHGGEAIATGENLAGAVSVHGHADGGGGGIALEGDGELGGDVVMRARGISHGDEHAVMVTPICPDCVTASGGSGGRTYDDSGVHPGGNGGEADSESVGTALGNSSVLVVDRAEGGSGGEGRGDLGAPGTGGIARSSALGVGAGTALVQASASAVGGRGGRNDISISSPGFDGRGGEAIASSTARGLGEVAALATAEGGGGSSRPGVSGAASARALAEGTSGEARAQAIASGFALGGLHAMASAAVASQAIAEAHASAGDDFERRALGGVDAFAIAAGLPSQSDVLAIGDGNLQVANAFAEDALDIVLTVAEVGFSNTQSIGGNLESRSAEIEIFPDVLEVSALQDVMVGFVNPEFIGSGFDSLRFRANQRERDAGRRDVRGAGRSARLLRRSRARPRGIHDRRIPAVLLLRLAARAGLRLDRIRTGRRLRRRSDRGPDARARAVDRAAPRARASPRWPRAHAAAGPPRYDRAVSREIDAPRARRELHLGVTPWIFEGEGLAGGLPEQAVLAESLGFDSLFLPESHFAGAASIPSPLLLLAARGRAHARGCGSAPPPSCCRCEIPIHVAEEVAVLDRLSQGRVILGMGRGFRGALFTAFEVPADGEARPLRRGARRDAARLGRRAGGVGGRHRRRDGADARPCLSAAGAAAASAACGWRPSGPRRSSRPGGSGFPISPRRSNRSRCWRRTTRGTARRSRGAAVAVPVMRTLFVSRDAARVERARAGLAQQAAALAKAPARQPAPRGGRRRRRLGDRGRAPTRWPRACAATARSSASPT